MSNSFPYKKSTLPIRNIRPDSINAPFRIYYLLLLIGAAGAGIACCFDAFSDSTSAAENRAAPTGLTADTDSPSHDKSTDGSNRSSIVDPDVAKRVAEILNAPTKEPDTTEPAEQAAADDTDDADDADDAVTTAEASEAELTSMISDAFAPRPNPEVVPAQPIRQETATHPQMVTPGNFEYLGAFRPPHVKNQASSFSYGGWAMAYHAQGDALGPDDGLPGSLFLLGHEQEHLVAEISIPQPVISSSRQMDDLSVAEMLQPFADITGGLRERINPGGTEPVRIGGLQVVGQRLHWTLYQYYNVGGLNLNSHGASSLNLAQPNADGVWHLGPPGSRDPAWHSYKHAGYIFEIPSNAAQQLFGGQNLISGLQVAQGLSIASNGPSMFSYGLPRVGTRNGAHLKATPLAYYDVNHPIAGFNPADRWVGGAWLTLGPKHTVVIAGRKSLGGHYYGEARPQDCNPYKGYHGTPYEAQLLFYAPQHLIASARGQADPQQIQPWYTWSGQTPGGGFSRFMLPTCDQYIGSVAYDRDRSLLYVCQAEAGHTADEPYDQMPAIHVFRIVEVPGD